MPEQTFMKLKKRVKKEWIICFTAAMLFGFAAHIYKLVNWLSNWDSLVFRYDAMNMTHFGRWLLSAACGISSYYDLPWLGGLFSLFYISLGAVCVSELFGFKKNVMLILTGGLIAVFPTVTSTLAYNYTADGYFLAFFLACLSVLLIEKGKKGFLLGTILIAFVLGIYQAYITVSVGLILLYLRLYCLRKGNCKRGTHKDRSFFDKRYSGSNSVFAYTKFVYEVIRNGTIRLSGCFRSFFIIRTQSCAGVRAVPLYI